MLGEAYTLEYLPLFDEELAAAVRCRWAANRGALGESASGSESCGAIGSSRPTAW